MTDWKTILAGADDEYLSGISNRGTVKRAHKDMETIPVQVLETGENEIRVKTGEEEVAVKPVLAESSCSCPSRSVCRHMVQAVLALRELYSSDAQGGERKDSSKEPSETPDVSSHRVWSAVIDISPARLIRTLGPRRLKEILGQIRTGVRAHITRSSVVTVELPDSDIRVRFLWPLEYSSCSCRKKDFCPHRAAAAIWCRLEAGKFHEEEFEQKETEGMDLERIRERALEMKKVLEDIFASGLSRTAFQSADSLERLAVISHNEDLASFEDSFRSLHTGYEAYFRRRASVSAAALMEESARLYSRLCRLSRVRTAREVQELGGVFRMEYEPAGTLHLVGLTAEYFKSKNGYEGETIYFLEEKTKEWYTYTSARPVFYDSGKKRGREEKAAVPWGLPLTLKQLAGARLCLEQAKAGKTGRLSSSQDTQARITGNNGFQATDGQSWVYDDFGRLFKEQCPFRGGWLQPEEERVRVVLIRAAIWGRAEFSGTEQKFSMAVMDQAGRELLVELAYDKQEDANIRYLERTAAQVERQGESAPPVIAGKLYLKDGRLCLHPLELFWWEPVSEELPDSEGMEGGEISDTETLPDTKALLRMQAIHQTRELLDNVRQQLEDLYQSGFDTVHDSTIKGLKRWEKQAQQSGLSVLGEQLKELEVQLEAFRHSLHPEHGPDMEIYTKLTEYLYLAKQKTDFDLAEAYYIRKKRFKGYEAGEGG